MKAVAILLLAIVAMAAAQRGGVNVVDNAPGPGQVNVVDQPGGPVRTVGRPNQGQIDPAFGRPSAPGGSGIGEVPPSTIITNPDPGFYLNPGSNNGEVPPSTIITNPDPGFYLNPGSNNGNVQPSIDPTFVDPGFYRPSAGQQYRPSKNFDDPRVRGGK